MKLPQHPRILILLSFLASIILREASAFSVPSSKSSRRNFLESSAAAGFVALLPSTPAFAATEGLPTREFVTKTFEPVKYELLDPNGGVAYMQGRIDAQDWAGLLEFTKTYDQELRKLRMGKAKKNKTLKLQLQYQCER